jgi:simple sugar transport system permease protein
MKLVRVLIFPLIAILAAFLVGGILVAIIGDDPILTYRLLIGSALSWPDGIGYTLFYATPLIFTGLAVAVGFRCGLLNIGAEGQLTIAAFATAWAGISFANSSPWLLVPLTYLVAILSGAAGQLPGVLRRDSVRMKSSTPS